MNMTKEEATKIILDFLNPEPLMEQVGDEYAVVDRHTFLSRRGWVFHVVSRRFKETNDPKYILLGQCPMIVEKSDGSVHSCGDPWNTVQTAIYAYEFKNNPTLFNRILLYTNEAVDFILRRQSGFPS